MLLQIHLHTTPYYILYKVIYYIKAKQKKRTQEKPNKRHYNYIR